MEPDSPQFRLRRPAKPALLDDSQVADLKVRMADEYRILQDKIDKIGAFRSTIKGWAVTAVGAATAATSLTATLPAATAAAIGLIFLVLSFFYFELEQYRLSLLFGARVLRIEATFANPAKLGVNFNVPGMASEIVTAGREGPSVWSHWRATNPYFYSILLLLSLVPILLHYSEIWEGVTTWLEPPPPIPPRPPFV